MDERQNAMRPPATPAGGVNAFRPGQAPASAPDLGQQIAALSPDQRAAAARQAEILAALGQSLAGRPYGERRAILAHMAPHLAVRGVAPATVAGFDPTDSNLAASVGHAVILRGMLTGAAAPDGPTPQDPAPTAE